MTAFLLTSPLLQDTDEPLAHVHFTAEGEVTFKAILFVPKGAPFDLYQDYGESLFNVNPHHVHIKQL